MDQQPLPPAPPQPEQSQKGIDRRTLLRAGAAAAPVIATLYSGPVAAQGLVPCTVASSFVSVVTFVSRTGSAVMQCSNLNVTSWHDRALGESVKPAADRLPWAKQKVEAYLGLVSSGFAGITVGADDYELWQVLTLPVATSGELGVLQHIQRKRLRNLQSTRGHFA